MASSPSARLSKLGLALPALAPPVGSYLPCKVINLHPMGLARDMLYTSGMIPVEDGLPAHVGKVGDNVSLAQAQECARLCVLNALAWVHQTLRSIDKVSEVVQVRGFVACTPDFQDHPKVLNAASDLLVDIFGESGKHARAAVGCSSLPLNVPVEIDFLFAL
jgi:enamine deaminase RidA (YjgF/YER057c/UK114 family)